MIHKYAWDAHKGTCPMGTAQAQGARASRAAAADSGVISRNIGQGARPPAQGATQLNTTFPNTQTGRP